MGSVHSNAARMGGRAGGVYSNAVRAGGVNSNAVRAGSRPGGRRLFECGALGRLAAWAAFIRMRSAPAAGRAGGVYSNAVRSGGPAGGQRPFECGAHGWAGGRRLFECGARGRAGGVYSHTVRAGGRPGGVNSNAVRAGGWPGGPRLFECGARRRPAGRAAFIRMRCARAGGGGGVYSNAVRAGGRAAFIRMRCARACVFRAAQRQPHLERVEFFQHQACARRMPAFAQRRDVGIHIGRVQRLQRRRGLGEFGFALGIGRVVTGDEIRVLLDGLCHGAPQRARIETLGRRVLGHHTEQPGERFGPRGVRRRQDLDLRMHYLLREAVALHIAGHEQPRVLLDLFGERVRAAEPLQRHSPALISDRGLERAPK